MSDFIIVFAVAILGLLAQAAGGKRVRRLVTVPATPVTKPQPAAHQELQSSSNQVSDSILSEAQPKSETTEIVPEQVKSEDKVEVQTSAVAKDVKSESESEPAAKADAEEVKSEIASNVIAPAASELETSKEEVKAHSETVVDAPLPTIVPPEVKTETGTATAPPPSAAPDLAAAAVVAPPIVREEVVSTGKPGIEYFLRVVIFLWFIGLSLYYYIANSGLELTELPTPDPWVMQVTFVTCALTGLGLVKSFRTLLSYAFTAIDCVFDIKFLMAAMKNWDTLKPAFSAARVFVPASIPHMVGLFIYVQTMFYLLSAMNPKTDFQLPGMAIPLPLPLDQLFSYNGLGLVMLAFSGCGIMVTRQFKEVMRRLALVKPTPPQIMIGVGLIFMSFMYDFLWAFYTHGQSLGLDTKLAGYNGGTFTASGGFTGALVLALATAIFAGVGEETLIRGALQPVFGLVPAAIMHGVLHAQFQHAPIFIVQVAGWSILMGIAKRYTNTTTTIIGHAGFNFVTSFLFAFNPPDM